MKKTQRIDNVNRSDLSSHLTPVGELYSYPSDEWSGLDSCASYRIKPLIDV